MLVDCEANFCCCFINSSRRNWFCTPSNDSDGGGKAAEDDGEMVPGILLGELGLGVELGMMFSNWRLGCLEESRGVNRGSPFFILARLALPLDCNVSQNWSLFEDGSAI